MPFFTLIPHFKCINAAFSSQSIRVSSFPVYLLLLFFLGLFFFGGGGIVPKLSQKQRWKWLKYKQHFGLCKIYIKKRQEFYFVNLKQAQNHQTTKITIFSDAPQYLMWFYPVQHPSLCIVPLCVFLMFCKNHNELQTAFAMSKISPSRILRDVSVYFWILCVQKKKTSNPEMK